MDEQQAYSYHLNAFDFTKVWPHGDFPLIEVRKFVLNINLENYFAEVEQAAFNPANIIPGIGFSHDKMLQGRLFSYGDAQRYRLGVNNAQIPVNAQKCPYHAFHRDGAMRVDGNYGAAKGYEPNSFREWEEQPAYKEPPLVLFGDAWQWNHREDDDYFSQPGNLFRLLAPDKKELLFGNTARAVGGAQKFIRIRHIQNCYKADPEYGKVVAESLGINLKEVLFTEKDLHISEN